MIWKALKKEVILTISEAFKNCKHFPNQKDQNGGFWDFQNCKKKWFHVKYECKKISSQCEQTQFDLNILPSLCKQIQSLYLFRNWSWQAIIIIPCTGSIWSEIEWITYQILEDMRENYYTILMKNKPINFSTNNFAKIFDNNPIIYHLLNSSH